MFKICNDKTYYVVQTTSEDVVVEIYTKKDGRGSGISLHEMHLDLCRAIRKLQHDGYTIMKVYPAIPEVYYGNKLIWKNPNFANT